MFSTLSLPILVGAAIIDSLNPCAFGVLIFLLAYLVKKLGSSRKILVHGLVYLLAIFITYLLAGLALLPFLRQLGSLAATIYLIIGLFLILLGLLEIKDFFWYGRGPSLAILPAAAKRIEFYIKRISDRLLTSFLLGIFVAVVELPCTGAVYLGVLALMSLSGVTLENFLLLIIYNLVFISPLLVILLIVYFGREAEKIEKWRQKHKAAMRLLTGLVLIGLGLWMILFLL